MIAAVYAWILSEGEVCSLQADAGERRALSALVRSGRALSLKRRCGSAGCRHYIARQ